MIAMHKPPSKSALRSGTGSKKKTSFATFQQYGVCKGYSYPASPGTVDDIVAAGYYVLPRERVILPPPPVRSTDIRWTVTEPPITFGTVNIHEISSAGFSVAVPTTLDVNLHVHGMSWLDQLRFRPRFVHRPKQSLPWPRLIPHHLPWPYQIWTPLIYLHLILVMRRILICN